MDNLERSEIWRDTIGEAGTETGTRTHAPKKTRTQRVFTDAYLKGLKPAERPYSVTEWAPRGEGRIVIWVLPDGVKEAFYRYRSGGVDKTIALGRYGVRTLADIRKGANQQRRILREHGDIKEHRKAEKRRKEIERSKGSLHQLLDGYVASLKGKPSARAVEGIFRRNVLKPFPTLAETKAKDITPDDISTILGRMVKRGITRQVNVTRSYLRAAFQWGAEADLDPRRKADEGVKFGLSTNPVALVPVIDEYERTRERHLSEEELREYWGALDTLPMVQRAVLRFALSLAGQRLTQLLRAGWDAFDFEQHTVLLWDSKGRKRENQNRPHLVPITGFALEYLEPLRALNGTPDDKGKLPSPFSSNGKGPIVLETLSTAVAEISKRLTKEKGFPPFQLRDVRRTVETMLQKLGIDKEVRAHLLSHGRTSGVQGKHYERYDFLPEKRHALERWNERLQQIVDPEHRRSKVIPLYA